MSMQPRISAVVCTHDRARYLQTALTSLRAQTLAPDEFEVVVVLNACTDDSAEVCAAARRPDGPPIRVVDEPTPGLSRARNRGWEAARAPHVAFLDDDAVADPDWLAALLVALARDGARVGCVGGRVHPRWEAARPAWLGDPQLAYLSVLDWGPRPRPIDLRSEWIVGANMAFPAAALRDVGGFSRHLGRVGANLLSHEETLLIHQLAARGWTTVYEPAATVGHAVPRERLRRRWLLRRAFWQGVSDHVLARELGWPTPPPVRAPLVLAARVLAWIARNPRITGRALEHFLRTGDKLSECCQIVRIVGFQLGERRRPA